MQVTFIGLVVVLAGIIMLFSRSLEALLAYTMVCTLMGGSGALIATSLGSSSISPANVALVFLALRTLMPEEGAPKPLGEAFKANVLFFCFAVYAALSAAVMPRIFEDQISVVPLKPVGLRSLLDSFPLKPSSQNITSPVYIFGSFLIAYCSFVAIHRRSGAVMFVKASIWITWIHIGLGLAGVLLPNAVWSIISSIFRNGSYAQVEQSIGGFVRIAGIFPEPSTYAGYGFCWLALTVELWLRDVLPRRTGPAAAAMAITLVISTSSSAYVSLAVYALIIFLRMVMFPSFFRSDKIVRICLLGLAAATLASLVMVAQPSFAESLIKILRVMTVDKADSESGIQRAFWARQGISAFQISYGLGIGAGSFRSSSLGTAILGSMGIIGTVTFLGYLAKIYGPIKGGGGKAKTALEAVGDAASWAAICSIIPSMIGAASPDPGANFAIFAGVALGLRNLQKSATRSTDAPHRPITSLPATTARALDQSRN